jgi:hypothetical protein
LESAVRRKTQKLLKAKQSFNDLVASVDQEFEEILGRLSEETIHISLDLARACITAIKKNRSLLPGVIEDLRESRALDDIALQTQSSPVRDTSRAVALQPRQEEEEEEEEDGALSGSGDSAPNLKGLSLDAGSFLKQFEQDDVELNGIQNSDDSA